mgnify:FL=1|tara:strand:+ start:38 stop:277 length:240 start_codon:yes stop_codon:yes gene_type:complete
MFNLLPCIFNKKTISNIKETKDHIVINKNFENNECIICLEPMVINDKVKILECGHMYHYDCINKWIEKKKEINCPLCSK